MVAVPSNGDSTFWNTPFLSSSPASPNRSFKHWQPTHISQIQWQLENAYQLTNPACCVKQRTIQPGSLELLGKSLKFWTIQCQRYRLFLVFLHTVWYHGNGRNRTILYYNININNNVIIGNTMCTPIQEWIDCARTN